MADLFSHNPEANVGYLTTGTPVEAIGTVAGLKYHNGAAWIMKPLKYHNGAAWVTKPLKEHNGSIWV